ncbi:MAG: hypothetical protein GY749_38065 [Desulfobacteraceae bacterium]|nr:hypothetical protein [Desulfobacteraceae bacterium]
MNEINVKTKEYEQTLTFLRHWWEYRTKIIAFSITINGLLLTVELIHIKIAVAKMLIASFGLIILIICFMLENRVMFILDCFVKTAIRLESELGFSLVSDFERDASEKGIKLRTLFRSLYIVMLIFWLIEIGRILNSHI